MPTPRAKEVCKILQKQGKRQKSRRQDEGPLTSPPRDVPSRRSLGTLFLVADSTVRCLAMKRSSPKGSIDGCSSANHFLVRLIEAFIDSAPYMCIQLENSEEAL
ncbi:hypothetical protein Adt_16702 [Abeliophyllum distichum]|uniref:Uncharacterized protein n=1 Tax=Abeliophyllum distichum TaxID=126358 RepID=A0ABD1TEF9_9LAMI